MSVPRRKPDDGIQICRSKTSNRPALEPRDEFARLPKRSDRALRPSPLNIGPKQCQSPSESRLLPPSRKESSDYEVQENLRDPEIVDFAPRGEVPKQQRAQRRHAPSVVSQRQSEISLGILDYYMRDRTSSLRSPDLPPSTPRLDPAMESFDFGLPPTPTPSPGSPSYLQSQDAEAGADRNEPPLVPLSPPAPTSCTPKVRKGYSLFPVIRQVTPPPRQPTIVQIHTITPQTILPSPPYRSRNASTSTAPNVRRIPLRILSNDSATRPFASPPSISRWSEDTIVSPPSTAGPRTSFGSLLRRNSIALRYPSSSPCYPDCFFEDDDDEHSETAPLRRRWQSGGASTSRSAIDSYGSGLKARDRLSFWRRVLLCGCGSGR